MNFDFLGFTNKAANLSFFGRFTNLFLEEEDGRWETEDRRWKMEDGSLKLKVEFKMLNIEY
jgi:hypothetical protein